MAGLLVDSAGERLTPSHAVKNGRRYRYYILRALIAASGAERTGGWRLPAHDVEDAVIRIIAAALSDPGALIERLRLHDASAEQTRLVLDRAARLSTSLLQGSPEERTRLAVELIDRVIIEDSAISIAVRKRLLVAGTGAGAEATPNDTILLSAPVAFRRRGVETKPVLSATAEMQKAGRVDPALVKAVARGRIWSSSLRPVEQLRLRRSPIAQASRRVM